MKTLLISLIFSLPIKIVSAQSDSIRGEEFELKGVLFNLSKLPPGCGISAFAIAIEFKKIEFSDPDYKSDSIAVLFTCPEFYGKDFFESGKTYSIKVSDENPADFGWIIINELQLTKYPLKKWLWVITAEKLD